MPFSSLAGAGFEAHGDLVPRRRKHPHPTRAMTESAPKPPPSDAVQPAFPTGMPPAMQTWDEYIEGGDLRHLRGARLDAVTLKRSRVLMHPSWRQTAIAGALRKPTEEELKKRKKKPHGPLRPWALETNAITPAMFESLAPETRTSLLDILHNVDMEVCWRDPAYKTTRRKRVWGLPVGKVEAKLGKTYKRRKLLKLPIGRHFHVSGAAGFAMRMAQDSNHRPFCDAMAAGLPWLADALRARRGMAIFSACDTADILADVILRAPAFSPGTSADMLDAASALVQRYLEQSCNDHPDSIRTAYEIIIKGLARKLPRDPDHVGFAIGVVISGVVKYAGEITTGDNEQRWKIASVINLLWACSSFAPFWFIAGPIALAVVAGGVVYDRYTPVRDYTTLLGRFECELSQLVLSKRVPWLTEAGAGRLFMRTRQVLQAGGLLR